MPVLSIQRGALVVYRQNPIIGQLTTLAADPTPGYDVRLWQLFDSTGKRQTLAVNPLVDFRPIAAARTAGNTNDRSIDGLYANSAGCIDWQGLGLAPGSYTLVYPDNIRTVGIKLQAPAGNAQQFLPPLGFTSTGVWQSDTGQLNDAILAMSKSGGGTIFMEGTYYNTGSLIQYPNVKLYAPGGARIIQHGSTNGASSAPNSVFVQPNSQTPNQIVNFICDGIRFETFDQRPCDIGMCGWSNGVDLAQNSGFYRCHFAAECSVSIGGDGMLAWDCTGDPGSQLRVGSGCATNWCLDGKRNISTAPLIFSGNDIILYENSFVDTQGAMNGEGAVNNLWIHRPVFARNSASNQAQSILFEESAAKAMTASNVLVVNPQQFNVQSALLETWNAVAENITILNGTCINAPVAVLIGIGESPSPGAAASNITIKDLFCDGCTQVLVAEGACSGIVLDGCVGQNRRFIPTVAGYKIITELPAAVDAPAGSVTYKNGTMIDGKVM